MDAYEERIFHGKVKACLEETRKILTTSKRLTTPNLVEHTYAEKYLVSNYLGRSAIACYLDCLSVLGLSASDLSLLVSRARSCDVFLRFSANETCDFLKTAKRDVVHPTRQETDISSFTLITSKQITTVTEYYFKFKAQYKLTAFWGGGDREEDQVGLQSGSSQQDIVSSTQTSPYATVSRESFEMNITWLLRCIDVQSMQISYSIDREHIDCHTPARNQEVKSAIEFFMKFSDWGSRIQSYFRNRLFRVQLNNSPAHVSPNIDAINTDGLFMPVAPLVFEENVADEAKGEDESCPATSSIALSSAVVEELLAGHARSLASKCKELRVLFPPSREVSFTSPAGDHSSGAPMVTAIAAELVVILMHMANLARSFGEGVGYIEGMIRDQLVAAIGKTLQASDFTSYMRFHNRKLYKGAYMPQPFCHAVRRTETHSPEGTIRIEERARHGSMGETIYTACCSRSASQAAHMQLPLNASTNVRFGGDRHLHTWLAHSFSGQDLPELKLIAQARQFSSFIVLVGRIASVSVFEPQYGMIVQNKDEVTIPLNVEQLPTPAEFRDAIASLSPEQQSFAKAYRKMQLESTLFGVLILQIKPQLEVVLKLSSDSLTKEIQLTQDLMKLFIQYQIPSDLLSYDGGVMGVRRGEESSGSSALTVTSPSRGIDGVKQYVRSMLEMISAAKNEEIKDKRKEALYNDPIDQKDAEVEFLPCRIDYLQAQGKMCKLPAYDGIYEGCAPKSTRLGSFRAAVVGAMSSVDVFSSGSILASQSGPATRPPASRCEPFSQSNAFNQSMDISPPAASALHESASHLKISASIVAPGNADVSTATSAQPIAGKGKEVKYGDSTQTNSATELLRSGEEDREAVDYTKYPSLLDARYSELDPDSALRPTIIKATETWTKKSFKSLMSTAQTETLVAEKLQSEKCAAFDLLDALSRGGALVMENASLHIIMAATHCFDKSLMDTIVQNNVNPIERVERSSLIMTGAIHGLPPSELLSDSESSRVLLHSPQLHGPHHITA